MYNTWEENVDSQSSSQTSLSVCSEIQAPEYFSKLASPAPNTNTNTITQSSDLQTNSATTVSKRSSEKPLFCKRGSKMKKSSTLMEEAVDALKQFCQPDPTPPFFEMLHDSAHTLASFVESRLRSLSPESRKKCKDEILKLLTKF